MSTHVSAVPNHQTCCVAPLDTRFHIALTGPFGYEPDLNELSADEQARIEEQSTFYQTIRPCCTRVIFIGCSIPSRETRPRE